MKFSLKDTFLVTDIIGDINIEDKALHFFDVNSPSTSASLIQIVDYISDYTSVAEQVLPTYKAENND